MFSNHAPRRGYGPRRSSQAKKPSERRSVGKAAVVVVGVHLFRRTLGRAALATETLTFTDDAVAREFHSQLRGRRSMVKACIRQQPFERYECKATAID